MTDAREIIVDELDKCICPADPWADAIISRLTTAGYRILGPDEVDPVTLERAAEVVECATLPMGRSGIRRVLAAAIRALGRKA